MTSHACSSGTATSAMSGLALARALDVGDEPITRIENYCPTGSDAARNAACDHPGEMVSFVSILGDELG